MKPGHHHCHHHCHQPDFFEILSAMAAEEAENIPPVEIDEVKPKIVVRLCT